MMIKECPDEKILNPKTNRCVKKIGKIGKLLLSSSSNLNYINIINEKNSCFLDSLLVSLFYHKNHEIYNLFFKSVLNDYNDSKLKELSDLIKNELLYIYEFIHKKKRKGEIMKCSNFRKLLQRYYDIYIKKFPNLKILYNKNDNWINRQVDVFELLDYLSIIFNFKHKKLIKIKEGSNINYSNFIIQIPVYEIYKKKEFDISKIIPLKIEKYKLEEKKETYEKRIEYKRSGEVIFIEIFRNVGSSKLRTKIRYPEEIKMEENEEKLKIRTLIIHIGEGIESGHYITLIKRDGKWYKYDDIKGEEMEEIDVEKYRRDIVGIFYSI